MQQTTRLLCEAIAKNAWRPETHYPSSANWARVPVAAKFPFPIHPHMLRHACGYKMANDGQDTRALQHYLGHKNIMHTVRYTELSPERFKNFWED